MTENATLWKDHPTESGRARTRRNPVFCSTLSNKVYIRSADFLQLGATGFEYGRIASAARSVGGIRWTSTGHQTRRPTGNNHRPDGGRRIALAFRHDRIARSTHVRDGCDLLSRMGDSASGSNCRVSASIRPRTTRRDWRLAGDLVRCGRRPGRIFPQRGFLPTHSQLSDNDDPSCTVVRSAGASLIGRGRVVRDRLAAGETDFVVGSIDDIHSAHGPGVLFHARHADYRLRPRRNS